jgi:hypothetical protein
MPDSLQERLRRSMCVLIRREQKQLSPKGRAAKWHSLLTKGDKALFKSIAGDMLAKWDYEKDLNW